MNEQRNNGKGIFYGVIGVATLIVAIIGATFAYFTATGTNNNKIKGNAATIAFSVGVQKVTTADTDKGGLIPMTNGMVGAAVSQNCLDDEGNAVCQIYKITLTNSGTAPIFLDGYVNLTGGAEKDSTANATGGMVTTGDTTMRWAQVFATTADNTTTYSVSGTPDLAKGLTTDTGKGISTLNLHFTGGTQTVAASTTQTDLNTSATTGSYAVGGVEYSYITNNYMRTSDKATGYSRSDTSSALVFSQRIAASTDTDNKTADLYIVVWLMEKGEDQTLDATDAVKFFQGSVTFQSGAGSEVSATFNGYTKAAFDTTQQGT